jgi:preprotein translocase subunit YajC
MTDWILFLDDQPPAAPGGLIQLLPYLPLVAIAFIFLFLMPQGSKRERAAREELRKNLKKHDRVLTTGGIYGVVMEAPADGDKVVLRIDEATNAKMTVTFSSIAKVLGGESSGDSTAKT